MVSARAQFWWSLPGLWAFFARLAGCYLGLLALWFPVGSTYREFLIGTGNFLSAHAFPAQEVLFLEYTRWAEVGVTERLDTAVLVALDPSRDEHGQRRYVLAKGVSTFYQPYTSVAFLLALFLATPLRWTQRLGRIAAATAGLHLAMLVVVWIDVLNARVSYGSGAGHPTESLRVILNFLHASVTDWPAGVLLIPLLLWILHCWPEWRAVGIDTSRTRARATKRDAARI